MKALFLVFFLCVTQSLYTLEAFSFSEKEDEDGFLEVLNAQEIPRVIIDKAYLYALMDTITLQNKKRRARHRGFFLKVQDDNQGSANTFKELYGSLHKCIEKFINPCDVKTFVPFQCSIVNSQGGVIKNSLVSAQYALYFNVSQVTIEKVVSVTLTDYVSWQESTQQTSEATIETIAPALKMVAGCLGVAAEFCEAAIGQLDIL
ncbi:hypothetical protein K9K77_01120 [Candidatus Babeliales bacterium]|nr:hypothetical protein [Candidatus Babeliales bacterium]